MKLYEFLSETTEHFPDYQKKKMLENLISPVKQLKAVKYQSDHWRHIWRVYWIINNTII